MGWLGEVLPRQLKVARELRGLTQRELAAMLCVAPSTIALYETGDRRPDPETLRRLANALECSVDYLLGRIDDPRPPTYGIEVAHRQDNPMVKLPREALEDLEAFKRFLYWKYRGRGAE